MGHRTQDHSKDRSSENATGMAPLNATGGVDVWEGIGMKMHEQQCLNGQNRRVQSVGPFPLGATAPVINVSTALQYIYTVYLVWIWDAGKMWLCACAGGRMYANGDIWLGW